LLKAGQNNESINEMMKRSSQKDSSEWQQWYYYFNFYKIQSAAGQEISSQFINLGLGIASTH
jgi:hypothetical protein